MNFLTRQKSESQIPVTGIANIIVHGPSQESQRTLLISNETVRTRMAQELHPPALAIVRGLACDSAYHAHSQTWKLFSRPALLSLDTRPWMLPLLSWLLVSSVV